MHSAYILWCQVSSSNKDDEGKASDLYSSRYDRGSPHSFRASGVLGGELLGFLGQATTASAVPMRCWKLISSGTDSPKQSTHNVYLCVYITCTSRTCEAHCRSLSCVCPMLRPAPKEASSLKKELSLLPTIQAVAIFWHRGKAM